MTDLNVFDSFELEEAVELEFVHPDFPIVEVSREVSEARIMRLIARGWFSAADAASSLGRSRATIYRRCQALNIDPKASRADFLARLSAHIEREQADRAMVQRTLSFSEAVIDKEF
jgi:hypothetical protein